MKHTLRKIFQEHAWNDLINTKETMRHDAYLGMIETSVGPDTPSEQQDLQRQMGRKDWRSHPYWCKNKTVRKELFRLCPTACLTRDSSDGKQTDVTVSDLNK